MVVSSVDEDGVVWFIRVNQSTICLNKYVQYYNACVLGFNLPHWACIAQVNKTQHCWKGENTGKEKSNGYCCKRTDSTVFGSQEINVLHIQLTTPHCTYKLT